MKIRFLLLLLTGVSFVYGQEKDCVQTAARLDSLVALPDYEKAYDLWKRSADCTLEPIFLSAEKILAYKLSTPLSDEQKGEYTAELLKLYSDFDSKIVGNKNSNLVKKAMFLHRRKLSPNEEIFGLLDRAFKNDRANFTDAAALYLYFDLYFQKYTQSQKTVSENQLFSLYDDVAMHLAELSRSTGNRQYETASNGLFALMAPIATCDNLETYYSTQFGSHRGDASWMAKACESLLARKCMKSLALYKIASEWQSTSPNAKSAYYLAKAMSFRGKQAEASKYYETAADLESDPEIKSEIYYTLAVGHIVESQKAIDFLNKALKVKPHFGQAYLLKAEVYASSNCGATDFEKKAIYFLAAQTARKAGEVDASLKKAAESTANAMLAKAPTKSEIKSAKKGGKTITYGCGINESVAIPE